ncbi:MAG TPA: phosphoribosyltransferase family protein [Acidimicrobiales bacterium]|nr:phosphoribosyltransferase family protein [Acidimicrobiales bacterium]
MFLPVSCPVCGALGKAPCATCAAALRRAPAMPVPVGVDTCAALLAYEGVGRELVARLKYRNARSSMPFLARGVAALTDNLGPVDVVTWAPTTAARRRDRGFDQAELLARAVARRLDRGEVACRRLLLRPPGPAQTGQPIQSRRDGPSFLPVGRVPPRVLLVDDVVTSGATVAAAARALRAAGAVEVHVVAAARTPRIPARMSARVPAPPSGLHSPRVAVCGSVVESRCQSQAKRPT